MTFHDKHSAIPFEELIYEMYQHQKDREMLLSIEELIITNKDDYCPVHLFTLINAIKGYLENM